MDMGRVKTDKSRWANIICDKDANPTMLIITNGKSKYEIPVSGLRLSTAKRAATGFFGVPRNQVVVSLILGNIDDDPDTETI